MQNDTEILSFFNFPIEQFPDRSAKWLLSDTNNVQGLLEIIAGELVEHLDFSQLKPVNTTFIPDNLRAQESDLVYLLPFRGEDKREVMIYILIEHQSTVDVAMGFRVLFYMTQIWDSQRREWESNNIPKSQWRLRPIIPIVFYTGERRWEKSLDLSALMDLPEALRQFIPTFETLFLSVKETAATMLTKTGHPFGWLMTVLKKEHADKEELRDALRAAVSHLNRLSSEDAAQWRRAMLYLYLLILHRCPPDEHEPLNAIVSEEIQELARKEEGFRMAQTMVEYLREQGMQQGIQQGIQQGEKRGETRAKREAVLKLLSIRFRTVPDSVRTKIASMRSHKRLEAIFEKAATAQTLEDIELE